MITKYFLPFVASVGLAFAIFSVVQGAKPQKDNPPAIKPPTQPAGPKTIYGAGLIEASMENIPIGANVPGVVTKLFVKVRQQVVAGQELFRTDDRNLQAELKVREANLISQKAQLDRLKAAPQQQDIPTAQAAVDEARARMYDTEIVYKRTAQLYTQKVSPSSDFDRDRYAHQASKAALSHAEADLSRIRITWAKDIEVSEAAVLQAQSQLEATKIELDRCTVRALVAGEVLQVNVRPGQFAGPVWKEPLIVLGDVKTLNVRVDIDEQDAPYFQDGAPAIATLKGRPEARLELKKVVKIEPYVIPKKSLTGDNSERVDTRVLQVVYALPDERPFPLFVGQQMDVYLRADSVPEGISYKSGPDSKRPFESSK